MKMQSIILILCIVVFVSFPDLERASAPPACQKVAIPLYLDPLAKTIEVNGSWLSPEPEGTLRGDIYVRNKTGKSLSLLTLIVNYLDENGLILFSIPYQANLPSEENGLRNVRPFSELHLNEPLESGDGVGLTARNLLGITKVPVSAEVALWLAKHYDDASSESHQIGQRGFRTDPLLLETPGSYLRLSLPHSAEAVETSLKLRINEYGRVLGVQPTLEGNTSLSQDHFEALSHELIQWHFFPGIENGYAVQSDLYLLVDFVAENPLPMRRCFFEHPDKYPQKFALVTLQPIPNTSNWIPYYGGFPAVGKMEPNIIELGPPAKPVEQ